MCGGEQNFALPLGLGVAGTCGTSLGQNRPSTATKSKTSCGQLGQLRNDRKHGDEHWSSGVKGSTAVTFKLTRVQPIPQDVRRKIEQRKLQARMLHARSAGPSQRPHGSTALPRKPSAAAEVAPLSPRGTAPPTTTLQVRLAKKTDRVQFKFRLTTSRACRQATCFENA